jgi:hypothetical protein
MTPATNEIQVYELLRQNFGNQEADAIAGLVDAKLQEVHDHNLRTLATKEDVKNVKMELRKVEIKLSLTIAETKTEIIRWLFAFFVPLLVAIMGLYLRK